MSDTSPNFLDALVLTGGGTGGHFFPAIALAEGARARWSERPIVFVGAQRGIEARELPRSPWPHCSAVPSPTLPGLRRAHCRSWAHGNWLLRLLTCCVRVRTLRGAKPRSCACLANLDWHERICTQT